MNTDALTGAQQSSACPLLTPKKRAGQSLTVAPIPALLDPLKVSDIAVHRKT